MLTVPAAFLSLLVALDGMKCVIVTHLAEQPEKDLPNYRSRPSRGVLWTLRQPQQCGPDALHLVVGRIGGTATGSDKTRVAPSFQSDGLPTHLPPGVSCQPIGRPCDCPSGRFSVACNGSSKPKNLLQAPGTPLVRSVIRRVRTPACSRRSRQRRAKKLQTDSRTAATCCSGMSAEAAMLAISCRACHIDPRHLVLLPGECVIRPPWIE